MYRVNYQIDKHNANILMICIKNGDSWSQLHDEKLEKQIEEKVLKIAKTYEVDNAYGEMHLTEQLNFITGSIDLSQK